MDPYKNFMVTEFSVFLLTAGESEKHCPQVHFGFSGNPIFEEDCVFSHNCAKVKCVAKSKFGHKFTMTVELKKCDEHLMLTVTLKDPQSDLDWSHTLKDGEKGKLPKSFGGGVVSHASLFIKVGIKKTNGNNFNYSVSRLQACL